MKIIAILLLFIGCIFSIYEMIDSNKLIRYEWFKNLDRSKKINATALLKNFWKKNIILIALMLGMILIVLSTFSKTGNRYENIISIISIIFAVLFIIFSILSRIKYDNKINEFK